MVGLSSINGDDASENNTSTSMKFDDDRWYTIRVRVNKDRIACWIDKEQMVDQIVGRAKKSRSARKSKPPSRWASPPGTRPAQSAISAGAR